MSTNPAGHVASWLKRGGGLTLGLDQFFALLTCEAADDFDGLVNAGGPAKAQVRGVFALEPFIVLDQGFAEEL
jgi:hypothetical protein